MNIASLPDDVLYKIFERAIPLHRFAILKYEAPLNVSHTCRTWRQLVISNGQFWTRIILALKEQSLKADIRMLSLWLERTADVIIDFSASNIRIPVEGADFLAWYRIAARKQSRWGKVNLPLYYYRQHREVEPAKLHNLSNLTEWEIGDAFPFGLEARKGNELPLFTVPIHQRVGRPIAPLLSRLSLSWFRANHEEHRGLLAMLRQCPNLMALRVHYEDEEICFDDINEPVCVMNRLDELQVEGSFNWLRLFRKIEAPSLRSLTASPGSVASSSCLERELPILLNAPRFGAPLVSATMHFSGKLDAESQLRLFKALSDIKDLRVSFEGDEHTCHLLSFDDDGGQLCPYLENLHVTFTEFTSSHSIESMLVSRYRRSDKFRASVDGVSTTLEAANNLMRWKGQGRLEIRY